MLNDSENMPQHTSKVSRRTLLLRALGLIALGACMYGISGGIHPHVLALFLRTPPAEGFIRTILAVQCLCLLGAYGLWAFLLISTGSSLLFPASSQQSPSVPLWARGNDSNDEEQDPSNNDEEIEEIRLPLSAITPLILTQNTGRETGTRQAAKVSLAREESVGPATFSARQEPIAELPDELPTAEIPTAHSPQQEEKPTPQQRLEECYQQLLRSGETPETITVAMLRKATRIKSETASAFLRNKRVSDEQPASGASQPTPQTSYASSRTHKGHKRANNEDSVLVLTMTPARRGLFAIADGMGGHANGAKASRFAIESLEKAFSGTLATLNDEQASEMLVACVHEIHTGLLAQNAEDVGRNQMGTTLTAALVLEQKVYIVNVGDSRVYWYSPLYDLTRITRDHSIVQQLIDAGELSEDGRYTDARRSHIYSSLGQEEELVLDAFSVDLTTGDVLLLCSDGLWGMVRDPSIEKTLATTEMQSLEEISQSLLDQALTNGGDDNISIIVVQAIA